MKNDQVVRNAAALLVMVGTLHLVGCNKTVVRENILSTIDTGIGLSLTENRQTQMYELKAGYIRNQFYSIPTGKVVESDNTAFLNMSTCKKIENTPIGALDKAERIKVFSLMSSCENGRNRQISNAANVTPELVSGIRAHTGLQDILLGMDVSESFAVGKEAVKSNAAVAMYIAMAKEPENAQAAAAAVSPLTYDTDPSVECLNEWLKDKNNVKTLNDWWKQSSQKGIGVLAIKAKENKEARNQFMKEHPEIKCGQQ